MSEDIKNYDGINEDDNTTLETPVTDQTENEVAPNTTPSVEDDEEIDEKDVATNEEVQNMIDTMLADDEDPIMDTPTVDAAPDLQGDEDMVPNDDTDGEGEPETEEPSDPSYNTDKISTLESLANGIAAVRSWISSILLTIVGAIEELNQKVSPVTDGPNKPILVYGTDDEGNPVWRKIKLEDIPTLTNTQLPSQIDLEKIPVLDLSRIPMLTNAQLPSLIELDRIPKLDMSRMPAGAVERLIKVQDDKARFALTNEDIQNGDTVLVIESSKMYYVLDDEHLDSENSYQPYYGFITTVVDGGYEYDEDEEDLDPDPDGEEDQDLESGGDNNDNPNPEENE